MRTYIAIWLHNLDVICLLKVLNAFDLIDVIMLYTHVHRTMLTGNDEELLDMEHDKCMLVNSFLLYEHRLLHMYMYTVFTYVHTYVCIAICNIV